MATLPPTARKRFGQHFLIDRNVLNKIVEFAALQPSDVVCEIGPGGGALTRLLCARARSVTAIEVDPRMVGFLEAELSTCSNLTVVQHDALRYPFQELPASTVVVANLPYNISTPLLFRLLDARSRVSRMVLMVQWEVAKRLAAKPDTKEYGVLSVMTQYLAEVQYGFPVSRNCFRPVPDVDSGVVCLDMSRAVEDSDEDLARFRRIVRIAFSQRRKTLKNVFRAAGVLDRHLLEIHQQTGIDFRCRAETLLVGEFRVLSRAMKDVLPGSSASARRE